MDPITAAILAAVSAGLIAGATKTAENALTDAYTALKDLIKRKFGSKSEVVGAIQSLEAKPDSTARKELLREEVQAARIDQDAEVLQAAKSLLDKLGVKPSALTQTATGDQNVQVAGNDNKINVNARKSRIP